MGSRGSKKVDSEAKGAASSGKGYGVYERPMESEDWVRSAILAFNTIEEQ